MRAVDTNILVRLIALDDQKQADLAARFIANGAWVSLPALMEAVWVLSTVYRRTPAELIPIIERLSAHEHLTLQDPDVVEAALALFKHRPSLGFSDCLILQVAIKAGHQPLGTFDRALGKVAGAHKL